MNAKTLLLRRLRSSGTALKKLKEKSFTALPGHPTADQRANGKPILNPSFDAHKPATPVSLETATNLAAAYRQANRKIVFTNGCFDLLHVGHIQCLEEASQHGDILFVAINSDASVRRLKGNDRPIVPEQDRARMLAALACVDHVLIFDEPTPHTLLHTIRPDILVKGGTTTDIVGREIVEAYGGRIERTTETVGTSTTSLMTRINPMRKPVLQEGVQ